MGIRNLLFGVVKIFYLTCIILRILRSKLLELLVCNVILQTQTLHVHIYIVHTRVHTIYQTMIDFSISLLFRFKF